MKQNEGSLDRAIRIIMGALLFFIGYNYIPGWPRYIFYGLSIMGIITGITGYCGIYKILGINTLDKVRH